MLPLQTPFLLSKSGGPTSEHSAVKGAVSTMSMKGAGLAANTQAPSSTEIERVSLYRKLFHELDRRRAGMVVRGEEDSPVFKLLGNEICCLEELIVLSTELGSLSPTPLSVVPGNLIPNAAQPIPSKTELGSGIDTWPADQPLGAVEGLDLSLITDMLMLSATSPWTVYVADRAKWTLCYVSPSVSSLLGWKQREMVGGSAWEGCHSDDMGEVTKMVWEGERMSAHPTVVCFRRLRRNCSYAIVQATGRPLGARWYAWVELLLSDAPTHSPPAYHDGWIHKWRRALTLIPATSYASQVDGVWGQGLGSAETSKGGKPPPLVGGKLSNEGEVDRGGGGGRRGRGEGVSYQHKEWRKAPSTPSLVPSSAHPAAPSPSLTHSNSLHRGTFTSPRETLEVVHKRSSPKSGGAYSTLPFISDAQAAAIKDMVHNFREGARVSGVEKRGVAKGGGGGFRDGMEEEGEESDLGAVRHAGKHHQLTTAVGRGGGGGGGGGEGSTMNSLDSSEEVETIWRARASSECTLDLLSDSLQTFAAPFAPIVSQGHSNWRAGKSGPSPTRVGRMGAPKVNFLQEDLDLIRGQKVLLVEDEVTNRTIGQRLLEALDCEVTVTSNGKEALEVMRGGGEQKPGGSRGSRVGEGEELPPHFDLVLMDLSMPVMDGLRAVEQFRDWEAEQRPQRKRALIFAVTANVTDGDMVKCAQSGFDEFVSKPLTLDKLIHRLHGVLKQRNGGKLPTAGEGMV